MPSPEYIMKITYDTDTDSISCPELTPDQTRLLQTRLSAALGRNEPVRSVVRLIMDEVRAGDTGAATP